MRRHTFTDDFEYQGVFWLPDKPEKHVPGTVSCNAEGINLHLFGLLYEGEKFEDRDRSPDFILGRVRKGGSVTLYQTIGTEIPRASGTQAGPPQPHHSSFVVNHLFVGAHFQSEDEVRFTEVGASFTHLEEWMGPKGKPIDIDFEDDHRTQIATYTPPNPIDMRVRAKNSEVSINSTLNPGPPDIRRLAWEHEALVSFVPDEQRDLDWYRQVLRDCQNLITLLVGRPVRPRRITAWLDESRLEVNAYGEFNMGPVEIFSLDYLRPSLPETFLQWSSRDVLVPLPSIEPILEQVFNAWFDGASLLRSVYTLYFSALYSEGMYLESEFLSLAQALEVFHRSLYGDESKHFSKSAFRRYREAMLSALPEEARDVFQDRLAHINEYTLKERLDDLSRRTPPAVRHLVVEDFDDFTTRVKDTRNLLTHYSSQKRAFTEEELIGANRRLRLWLMALLLLEIGIAEPMVIEAMQKYKRRNFPTELLPKNNGLNQGMDV